MRISDWSSDVCSSDLIGRMTVHPRRRQHMRLIDRHALRFVDGGGIAMIDMGIVLEVERDPPAIVEPHRHAVGGHALDLAQRAVLHAKAALVFQEHDAVAAGELPCPPFGRHAHRSEEHTSELQSLMRTSYAVFCLKKKKIP